MAERTSLTLYRNSDVKVTYSLPDGYNLSGFAPVFYFRASEGESPLLTVSEAATGNGSVAVVAGDAVVLTVKAADVAAFPAGDIFNGVYDSTLTKDGFVNRFVGGPLVAYVDGSYGEGTFSDSIFIDLNGKDVGVIIEGGNLGIAASVDLALINAAVTSAANSATSAANSAMEAAATAANKLDIDGDNAAPGILTNIGAVGSTALAAGTGSTLVGFIQGGTGAGARTAEAKLRVSVSVEDCLGGQDPNDPLFDSTTAFQAAITYVASKGGGFVDLEASQSYYANPVVTGNNVWLRWVNNGKASLLGGALRPFDGTKATLTIGDGTTLTRNCGLICPNISGVKIGGNFAVAADNVPAALDIKGNVSQLEIQQPDLYGGLVTMRMIPSPTKEIVSVKVFGGAIRNDIADSTSARTVVGEYVNSLGYFNDVVFFGTKFNGPAQGNIVEYTGGALLEAHGVYMDMQPGAVVRFATGGAGLLHGCNLDPHGLNEIIIVTDDLTTDLNRVVQGDFRHGPQKWQNGSGTIFDIPDQANFFAYRGSLRDVWLNGQINFGRSTDRFSTTEYLSPRTDTGPMDLVGMDWSVRNTTQATDLNTAALQTEGGLSVKKDARVGGVLEIYGGNAISGGQITASSASGGLFIASNVSGEDVQIVPGGGAYLRVRGGAGVRTHDDNVQANGITGNAWAYTTSYAYRDGAGVKILGAQGAAVADATDAGSAITQLNALLARMRAHGLIAT